MVSNVSAPETDSKGELTARASKGDGNDATKAIKLLTERTVDVVDSTRIGIERRDDEIFTPRH